MTIKKFQNLRKSENSINFGVKFGKENLRFLGVTWEFGKLWGYPNGRECGKGVPWLSPGQGIKGTFHKINKIKLHYI